MNRPEIAALSLSLAFAFGSACFAHGQEAESVQIGRLSVALAAEDIPPAPSRVVEAVNDSRLATLKGNVHPDARPQFDKGRVDPQLRLDRLMLVLQRSPEQEKALAEFNQRQYDPKSPDFHHWLDAEEFGKLYGPSDADITAITSWLQNQGFSIFEVSKGRTWIQFSGTVDQTEKAFHIEMHRYLVEGKMHIANDRNPQIPQALQPVVTGIASLHDFRPQHFSHPGPFVRRNMKTGEFTELDPDKPSNPQAGKGLQRDGLAGRSSGSVRPTPEFGYTDGSTGFQREMLTPYDVATIYNILPLWNAATPINGNGVSVAIVALSDVKTADFNTYRSSFGLPAATLKTVHSGADPGITNSQGENTEDTEMVSATAPGANVILVADVDNATTDGLLTAIAYITDNAVAPILTMSYGACELKLGTAGNKAYNLIFQQASTAGISSFVAAGDSGSAVCTGQNGQEPYADEFGLAVSGMASNPFVTAVGGTDLQWPFVQAKHPVSTYWNATNDPKTGASAKGYMPEMTWNTTCTNPLVFPLYTDESTGSPFTNVESFCNAAIDGLPGIVIMGGGSGGKSACTTNDTTNSSTTFDPTSCSGGYAKPSWQAGVTGIPVDGKRDIPDVSMFASYSFRSDTGIPGTALLICQSQTGSNGCDYSDPDFIVYQENGGTSAASPMTAGIMALVLQKTGAKQGLANPVLYSLAAKETYANCNSNTVAAGNSCVFYDTTTGSNAMVCVTGDPNCNTSTSGDEVGVLSGYKATTGYDLTTGLGTMNVANLVKNWPTTTTKPTATLSPATLTFASTKVGSKSAALTATLKNTGTTALTISASGITISGTNATSFSRTGGTCTTSTAATTLAAGASCTVTIAFAPTKTGTLTALLEAADNAATSPQKVTLSGTGAATTTGGLTITPATVAFPSTSVGAMSVEQAVTLKNTGTAAVTLHSIAIAGTNPTSFVQIHTCPASLTANASCIVYVALKPASAGALKGTLSVSSTASATATTAALSGTGTAKPSVTLSKTTLTFATTAESSESVAQSVIVTNKGTTALNISGIAITGTNATSFIQVNSCGPTLAPAATCMIDVALDPKAVGPLKASLVITDNGSTATQTIALVGTGAL
jgi:hypothetical protein